MADSDLPSSGEIAVTERRRSSLRLTLDDHKEARGPLFNGCARGALNMSNVYLSNSLILLACRAGGGSDPDTGRCIDPNVRIYGMTPISLISNILFASTILTALIMPVIGAIIDFTRHRKLIGVVVAILLTIMSGVQIGTVKETWFAMAILQFLMYSLYQVELMTVFAYFPEIARDVGGENFNSFSSTWSWWQFVAQAIVNLIIFCVSFSARLDSIKTAMLSQGLTVACCAVFLTLCWKNLPDRPRKHVLPKGEILLLAGFKQNFYMTKKIWRKYKSGLRWFLLSTVFSEAAATAVGSTAIIFLNLNLQLSPVQISIFYEVSLVGVIFGTKLGAYVAQKTNPKIALIAAEIGFCLTTVIGCWAVQGAPYKELSYLWGFSIGIFLGWFYPNENLVFALSVPHNVEAELTGFFQNCSQIMGWLPPLVFTIMVENKIQLSWALTVVAAHFIPGLVLLCCCGPWETILEEAKTIEVDFSFVNRDEGDDEGEKNNGEVSNLDCTEPEKIDQC